MRSDWKRFASFLASSCALLLAADAGSAQDKAKPPAKPATAAATDYEAVLKPLRFREIGPAAMGGRIDDFAVVESDPDTFYVGTASGGVLKTTNGGTTFQPVFDDEAVPTIGDITVAPSDPSVVWVGTGESNNRQSSSWGNGVYRSTDAGRTWKHAGLSETHHIARIVVHPSDPATAYVAATGRLWGASKERGVYKTTDGGKTWSSVLFVNEDTGCTDIAIDHESPGTLIAAMYQRRRTVFGFSGSGPGSGLYKTTDGGASWKRLENGLPWDKTPRPSPSPAGGFGGGGGGGGFAAQQASASPSPTPDPNTLQEIGRIGVNFYRRDTKIVYALVEHAQGGIYRSEDKGETWTKMSDTNPRPMYYSKVHVDPNNDQRIWVLGAQMFYSEDGGKTFRTNLVQQIHGDHHAMWIDPRNSDHMLLGSDGGIHGSRDRGATWDFLNIVPLGQFYEIGLDMAKPYNICGGLQDNNSWCGPSATLDSRGIQNSDWFTVGGGDGFYAQIDQTDPNIVYAESQDGNVLRRNLKTHESRSIRPQPAENEARYRFQWNSPILMSAHDPKTIYYAGNFLFKSQDRGDTWTKVSPDLTNGQERDKQPIMGKVPDGYTLSRHDGVQQWPAATTTSESPRNRDVLWVGTDDGNLQVTRDGGKTWKNVADRCKGVPRGTYVSRVVASRHAEGTAYATFDGHRMNDFGIYVFMTSDYGETWRPIRDGIPDDKGIVNVIREHHRNPRLLFAGAEYGAYVSFDQGARWSKLKLNLPTVPVDDIQIHPRDNDLVFATHGRSIWILDDITPLEQMSDAVAASDLHLFDVRPATSWRIANRSGSSGHKAFFGPNPPNGATIHYYLKAKSSERVRVAILDKDGKAVRELDGSNDAGINRVVWDLRTRAPFQGLAGGFGGGGGGGGFGGGGGAPRVEPGEYTVKVSVGGKEQTKRVVVEEDPRIEISAADRVARRRAIDELAQMAGPAMTGQRSVTGLRTSLNNAIEAWKRPGAARAPEHVQRAAEELLKKVDTTCKVFANPNQCGERATAGLGAAGPPLVAVEPPITQRMTQLLGGIEGYTAAPTAWQLDQIRLLQGKLNEAGAAARRLVQEDLAALNKMMNDAGMAHIALPAGGGRQGAGGAQDEERLP